MSRKELAAFIALVVIVAAVTTRTTVQVVFCLAVAGLLFAMVVRRHKKTILIVLSLTVAATLFEVVGSAMLKAQHEAFYGADVDHRMKPDPARGINEDGIRSADSTHHPAEAFNIVFLGDSFTYGFKVKQEEAFPSRVGELLGQRETGGDIRIANFGWVSASPLLAYRILKDVGQKYNPDLVVLCVDMTDFHDDLRYRARLDAGAEPSFSFTQFLLERSKLKDTWQSITAGFRLPQEEVEDWAAGLPKPRYFITNWPLKRSRKFMKEIERNIGRIAQHCRTELGAQFLLVLLPRNYQYSAVESPDAVYERGLYQPLGRHVLEPFQWLEELSKRVRFPTVSLLPDFKNTKVFPTCFTDDPHWNVDGHRIAAQALVRHMVRLRDAGRLQFP